LADVQKRLGGTSSDDTEDVHVIKTWLAQYEIYLWAALAVALIVLGVITVHHLEQIGVDKEKAAEAKVLAAQQIHKDEVEQRAKELTDANDISLRKALGAPVPSDALTVRMCNATIPITLPPDGAAGAGSDSNPFAVPRPVAGNGGSQGIDIGPDTEALFAKADGEIAYWRAYYATCKDLKVCR
jgi:heme exporter protein D